MRFDVYVALGSNIGDRELNLLMAVAELGRLPDSRVTGLSSFYETSPVDCVSRDKFYNAVARLTTPLPADELLKKLLDIESRVFKRVRAVANGPRRMDLDILLYGDMIVDSKELTLPHPRLAERLFVLLPLCDVAADVVHPVNGKTMSALLAGLVSEEVVVKIA